MEFDKTKVYTVFNADEVKVGSKGYFADAKEYLMTHIQSEDKDYYCTLEEVNHNSELAFITKACAYRYFYLVEEPKEKTKRPCNREELIEMLKEQGLPMLINKHNDVVYSFLYLQSEKVLTVSTLDVKYYVDCSYEELCESFTLLDGTELWVEE